jgi:hypothetical protein
MVLQIDTDSQTKRTTAMNNLKKKERRKKGRKRYRRSTVKGTVSPD